MFKNELIECTHPLLTHCSLLNSSSDSSPGNNGQSEVRTESQDQISLCHSAQFRMRENMLLLLVLASSLVRGII